MSVRFRERGSRAAMRMRRRVWSLLERHDHGAGRILARAIAILILLNVAALILESVAEIEAEYGRAFSFFEAISVAIFVAEYFARLWSSAEEGSRLRFAFSPFAVIDLVAILPFFLGSIVGADLRVLRLLRLFKLFRYFTPLVVLGDVLKAEARPLAAAIGVMAALVVIAASAMYMLEGRHQPEAFGDIPKAMWWSAVTLTTVGYGDVAPITSPGRVVATFIMALGVGMVALPSGMLASRFSEELKQRRNDVAAILREEELSAAERSELTRIHCISDQDLDRLSDEAGTCPECGANLSRTRG